MLSRLDHILTSDGAWVAVIMEDREDIETNVLRWVGNYPNHQPQTQRNSTMARTRSPYLAFVADFVDSVTVRPFMHDLKRMKDKNLIKLFKLGQLNVEYLLYMQGYTDTLC